MYHTNYANSKTFVANTVYDNLENLPINLYSNRMHYIFQLIVYGCRKFFKCYREYCLASRLMKNLYRMKLWGFYQKFDTVMIVIPTLATEGDKWRLKRAHLSVVYNTSHLLSMFNNSRVYICSFTIWNKKYHG